VVNFYKIEWVRFDSGERLPLLVRRETGLPIEAPTYWITASERPLNKAAATLEKQLRHLMWLYLWADTKGQTPEDFIRSPAFLTLEQLNDLSRFCRLPLSEAIAAVYKEQHTSDDVAPLHRRRFKLTRGPGARADIANRLATICAFLDYTSFSCASRMKLDSDEQAIYGKCREAILKILREQCSAILPNRNREMAREGLAQEERELLLAVIKPGNAQNPWDPRVQKRNELIVRLLYELGMRRGEVLCLRARDVRLTSQGGLLTIVRRPLDPEDPRQPKPQVKTLGRELAIGAVLRDAVVGYLEERRKLVGSRRHPFLFVSSTDGRPLSLWSMTKIFRALRERVPSLPDNFTAHVLRHDWNDRFSEMSDRASPGRTETDAVKEERLRTYIQGWSNQSTASRYTQRWAREAANKRVLEMQNKREILIEPAYEHYNQSSTLVGEGGEN